MPRQAPRDRQKPRPKRREKDRAIELLIGWLSEKSAIGDRARKLFRLTKSLDEALKRDQQNADAQLLIDKTNTLLERLEGVRTLFLSSKGVISVWGPKGHGSPLRWLMTARKEITREDLHQYCAEKEFAVVGLLMDALERRSLSKIGECGCGALFYARSSLSRFCSDECRIRFWEQCEERKAQKREMARKYYWLKMNKNVK